MRWDLGRRRGKERLHEFMGSWAWTVSLDLRIDTHAAMYFFLSSEVSANRSAGQIEYFVQPDPIHQVSTDPYHSPSEILVARNIPSHPLPICLYCLLGNPKSTCIGVSSEIGTLVVG